MLRKRVATSFKLELAEMKDRHHLNFDTYEEGKAHAARTFRLGGFPREATVHPGSGRLMFAAIETLGRLLRWSATKDAN